MQLRREREEEEEGAAPRTATVKRGPPPPPLSCLLQSTVRRNPFVGWPISRDKSRSHILELRIRNIEIGILLSLSSENQCNVADTNHGPETISRLTRAYLITGQHSTISLILHIVYPFMVVDCSTARPRPGCNCAKRQRWLLVLEGSLTGRQQADRFYLSQTDRQSVVGLKNSNFLRSPPLCKAKPRVGRQPEWRWQLFMNFCPFPLTCCG